MAEDTLIESQLTFPAMHLWKRAKAFLNCTPMDTGFLETRKTTIRESGVIRLSPGQ